MQRIPEPELMEDPLQAKAYADADFGSSDEDFVLRLEQMLNSLKKNLDSKSVIIDFGCGPGNITERIASHWPSARVCGIDGSKAMLDIAMQRKGQKEPQDLLKGLSYFCFDISLLSSAVSGFEASVDVLVSNSLIHHLHQPMHLWNAVKRFAAPGAVIFFRDLRRPTSYEDALNLQEKHLQDSPPILVRDYLASLQASFSVEEIRSQLNEAELGFLKVEELEDRYLEISGSI